MKELLGRNLSKEGLMTEYKAYGIVDGKPRWTIVDEDGKVINKYPEKKELEILKIRKSDKKKYTDEELVDYLKQFFVENGRIPVAKDFLNNPEYPSIITYQKRFGSWNKALTFAKLDNRAKSANSKKYTDKELWNFLNIFYEDNGKVPTRRDFLNNLAYPDYQT